MLNIEYSAASLYDGGWRAKDRNELIDEHEFVEEDAREICNLLLEFEIKEESRK